MTYDQVCEHLEAGGYIDCGEDDNVKLQVLDFLETIGYEIGFNKQESVDYRYVYFDNDIYQIHMTKYKVESNPMVLYEEIFPETEFDISDLSELYDWIRCCPSE